MAEHTGRAAADQDSRPDIVFIMADQLRPDFLGCYGGEAVETPSIDSLASEGVVYENAVTPHPICVPARTAVLSGMHGLTTGVLDNMHALRPDHQALGYQVWPELLASAGYRTAAIGKMHFHPWDTSHGFAYRVAAEDKRWLHIKDDHYRALKDAGFEKYHGSQYPNYEENQGAIVSDLPRELTADGFTALESCRFIENHADDDQPLALMVGFPGPHDPYDPLPEFLSEVNPDKLPEPIPAIHANTSRLRELMIANNLRPWNGIDYTEFSSEAKMRIRQHYAASIAQIDREIGDLLAAINRHRPDRETVVILTSDHGDYLGDHDLIGKASFFEPAIRVPLIVRDPASAAPSGTRVTDLVSLPDITATILTAGGCHVPTYMDSMSLPDHEGTGRRKTVLGTLTDGWMLREERFKLHRYATGDVLLFDLSSDPHEQYDLSDDPRYRDEWDRLNGALAHGVMSNLSNLVDDRRLAPADLSQDAAFGLPGWKRPYPYPIAGQRTNGHRK